MPVEILDGHSRSRKVVVGGHPLVHGTRCVLFQKQRAHCRRVPMQSTNKGSRAITMLKERELIEVSTDGRRRKCRARVDNLSMQGRQSGEAESPKCLHSKQDREQPRKQVSRAKPNSRDEVHIYFNELGMDMAEGDRFVDYYESNGWKQGRGKAIKIESHYRNWQRNAKQWATKSRGFDAGNFSTNGAIDFVVNG